MPPLASLCGCPCVISSYCISMIMMLFQQKEMRNKQIYYAYLVLYHRAWNSTHGGEVFEMLARRQQIEKDVVLRTDSCHAAYRPHVVRVADIVAEYEGGAGSRCGKTRENVEEGGLAGAIVSEDGGDLPLVDGQIDAVHSLGLRTLAFVIRFVEIGYPDGLAALHFAHHRLHVAIRLLARNERV